LPAAAQDMAGIGSTISEARAAAAGATTGVVAAAVAKAATLPGGAQRQPRRTDRRHRLSDRGPTPD
jgi:hypothetical protein